jgi:hypothetical protein
VPSLLAVHGGASHAPLPLDRKPTAAAGRSQLRRRDRPPGPLAARQRHAGQRRDPSGSPDTVDAGAAPEGCGASDGVCDTGGPVAADAVGARAAGTDVTSSGPAFGGAPAAHRVCEGCATR